MIAMKIQTMPLIIALRIDATASTIAMMQLPMAAKMLSIYGCV